jgi:DNA-binding transcriptional MerR regulator
VCSLRHYETIGLLTPEYIDQSTGCRYYSVRQFEVLNTIRYLRALDMPLSEIADFLQNKDVELIEEKLRQQKETVVAKQQELKRIERKIDNRLKQLWDAQNSVFDTVRLISVPSCRIVWVQTSLTIRGFLDMETSIRELEQSQAEAVAFLGKVGGGISEDNQLKMVYPKTDG